MEPDHKWNRDPHKFIDPKWVKKFPYRPRFFTVTIDRCNELSNIDAF
jgi:hypothetical protein